MSFLDTAKNSLNDEIFDENGNFRDDRLNEIKTILYRIVAPDQVDQLYLLGSMAGYQYNDNSDIDITVILRDGADREYYHQRKKKMPKAFLSGTNHEITFFFQKHNPQASFEDAEYAVYDLNSNRFVSDPKRVTYDPKIKFRQKIDHATRIIDNIGRLVKEYEQDKQDLANMDAKSPSYKAKMREINEDIEKLVAWFRKLDQDRKVAYYGGFGVPRESQQNITYKMFEYSQYKPIIEKLEKEFGEEIANLL